MRTGALVTYKCYKNIKKINNIGVILEIQQNLILKELVGFEYEDLLRIYWFATYQNNNIPVFRTDHHRRKWYLSDGIYTITKDNIYGNV